MSIRVVTTLIAPEFIMFVLSCPFDDLLPVLHAIGHVLLKILAEILVITTKSVLQNFLLGIWTAEEKDTFLVVLGK